MTVDTDHIRCINEGRHVSTQRHPRSECPEEPGIDARLRVLYTTAMKHQHEGGRVEMHLGADVVAYLRSLCKEVPGWQAPPGAPLAWGFPVAIREDVPADHMSIHVVHTIY